ncbi:MAG TPA: hypothetical protein VFP71_14220 [Candidatus Angelobacter sp.]|nr:hypothetical protein [Candidatus Angelobacter sp.]
MNKLLIIFALLLSSASMVVQHQPPREAQEQVELGLKAWRIAHFEEATQHFERAVAIDQDFCWARLHLAGSLQAEYDYHLKSADILPKAFEYYQAAIKCDPALTTAALRGMASVKELMEQPAEARDFYRQLLKIEGGSEDIYGHIAAYDLQEALANTRAEKARLGLKPDQSLADTPACPALRKRNLPLVEDGLQMLSKAMWLHTDGYGGDQVTASIFYRERTEIECGDPEARKADLENARFWNDLAAKIARKLKDASKQ